MTEQQIKEIVKSFAYGYAAEQIVVIEGMSLEDAKAFEKEHAADIEAKKAELKGGGWND